MKRKLHLNALIACICMTMCLPFIGVAQSNDIQILEDNKDGVITLSAKNSSKHDYRVTLNVESQGMDLSAEVPYTAEVHAGKVVKLLTLTPQPGQAWSYRSSASIVQIVPEQPANEIKPRQESVKAEPSEDRKPKAVTAEAPAPEKTQVAARAEEIVAHEGLTILMQPGCGRTMKVTEAFDLYKVPYEMVPVNDENAFRELVSAIGKASGEMPRTARSPVIMESGKPNYAIDDLEAFVKEKQKQYGTPPEINTNPGLVLYRKAGCGRCTFAKSYLKEHGVQFTEIDLTSQSKETAAMWDQLRAQGMTGNRIQTPVIGHEGKLYHEIPDLKKFLEGIVVE